MSDILRAAVVQTEVAFGDVEANLTHVLARLDEAAEAGAGLVVFTECALTGYCFESMEEARPAAEAAHGAIARFADRCGQRGVAGVLGTLLIEDGRMYNAAAVVSADGARSVYHKTHLPTLGIDRFISRGGALQVHDLAGASIGTLVCYDIRFPETARCLTVMGAEILAVPTNWPEGAESAPEYVTRARARENGVYVLAANRVGTERGTLFIGRSQIVAPSGEVVAQAGGAGEALLVADLDLAWSRRKRVVVRPGEYEMDVVGDRRPELYGALLNDARGPAA